MYEKYKKYLLLVACFAVGFALAMTLGRKSPVPESAAQPTAPLPVDQKDLADFLVAAERSDYQAMKQQGDKIFQKGRPVPDAEKIFHDYAANSFPPFTVYAFLSEGDDNRVRRVLLTLDADKRVESFLAEEMAVVK